MGGPWEGSLHPSLQVLVPEWALLVARQIPSGEISRAPSSSTNSYLLALNSPFPKKTQSQDFLGAQISQPCAFQILQRSPSPRERDMVGSEGDTQGFHTHVEPPSSPPQALLGCPFWCLRIPKVS